MRKTILTVAAAFMLVVTSVSAENKIDLNDNTSATIMVESFEINSFCKAIIKGDLETVQKLISLGEDVNKKSLGMTPAMFAARYNKAEILELLIKSGANLRTKSDDGHTAKKYAELSNAVDALAVIEAATES
ncbi:ankyrin repeat domain-containing protein [Spongiimicrobium sp. 3-5]|uniref:ankyrin repeat domain-containing protein n=1 Tax=Spongiimicrobium sp. 3-5 TaxID=3332596 RepID=UPI00397F6CAA